MNAPLLTVRPLSLPDDPLREPILRLYEASFPDAFREDTDVFLRSIGEGDIRLRVAVDTANGGALAGFFAYVPPQEGSSAAAEPVMYLPYLAAHPDYRGKGVAGPVLWGAVADVAEQTGARAVLLEVEKPEDDPEHYAGRIRFYQRQARWPARLLQGGYRYVQVIPGRHDHPTMWLMVATPASRPLTPDAAFALCQSCFGDSVERLEGGAPLRLEGAE